MGEIRGRSAGGQRTATQALSARFLDWPAALITQRDAVIPFSIPVAIDRVSFAKSGRRQLALLCGIHATKDLESASPPPSRDDF